MCVLVFFILCTIFANSNDKIYFTDRSQTIRDMVDVRITVWSSLLLLNIEASSCVAIDVP